MSHLRARRTKGSSSHQQYPLAIKKKETPSWAVNVLMTRPFDRRIERVVAHVRGCFPRRRRKKRYFNRVESLIRPGQTNTDCADKNNTSEEEPLKMSIFSNHRMRANHERYCIHQRCEAAAFGKCPEYPSNER